MDVSRTAFLAKNPVDNLPVSIPLHIRLHKQSARLPAAVICRRRDVNAVANDHLRCEAVAAYFVAREPGQTSRGDHLVEPLFDRRSVRGGKDERRVKASDVGEVDHHGARQEHLARLHD